MLDFLREEGIDPRVIQGIGEFRRRYAPSGDAPSRPRYYYYGKKVWEQAAQALLAGENLLLAGAKATGKNVLAENLAAAFGRPVCNISLHINADATTMLGTDTFRDGEVTFRPGPVTEAAEGGGFCVLDEINMARNEALAVLHSVLDFRRSIRIPGYRQVGIHGAARFIATMNYGYAGTRELNEALSSRFMILTMPEIAGEDLSRMLQKEFPLPAPGVRPPVHRPLPRHTGQVQERRTDRESAGSARSSWRGAHDGRRPCAHRRPQHGHYLQDAGHVRAVSCAGHHLLPHLRENRQRRALREPDLGRRIQQDKRKHTLWNRGS